MAYETTEHDPILGARRWRVSDCAACDGTGAIRHQGCDDRAASCGKCDGCGQTAVYKEVGIDGKPWGHWKTED